MLATEELIHEVDELELRVERLRILYDQYFVGIEKIPPHILQKDVERRIWVLRREKIRNSALRFRFQQTLQRLNTFMSYWQRICREIENGTYKRDRFRAQQRLGLLKEKSTPSNTQSQSTPENGEYQSLYTHYINTRRNNGEATEGLNYELFSSNLQATRARIQAQYSGRDVKFHVYVKEGKTILKPVFV